MRRILLLKRSIPMLVAGSLASLGALAAASLATADGLPGITISVSTPSVSLPSVTTPTLPVTVPGLTGTTTTTPETATTPGSTVTGPSSSDPPASAVGPTASAIGLPSGTVSVAASSLRASTPIVIDRLRFSPTTVRARKQALSVTLRVLDDQGHVVRGASVSVHSIPSAASRAAKAATSIFGTASLRVVTTSHLPTKPGSKLLLLLRVTAGRGNVVQVARLLAVPVRLKH